MQSAETEGVIIFKKGTVDTLELIHFPRIFCFIGTEEKAVTGVGRCAHTCSDVHTRSDVHTHVQMASSGTAHIPIPDTERRTD